jgi:hypothetical protein
MTEQEEKQTSIDYLLKELDAIMLIPMNNWTRTKEVVDKAKLMRNHELTDAYEKGYQEGYQEGVKYTDGMISDERYPF